MTEKEFIDYTRPDIVAEVDGLYYFFLNNFTFLTAYQLRWIADELDRLNEPYQKEIDKYFNKSID
jgi:hypothetical protein